jgi:hypothetical protein
MPKPEPNQTTRYRQDKADAQSALSDFNVREKKFSFGVVIFSGNIPRL